MINCPNCNKQLEEGVRVCDGCGRDLSPLDCKHTDVYTVDGKCDFCGKESEAEE